MRSVFHFLFFNSDATRTAVYVVEVKFIAHWSSHSSIPFLYTPLSLLPTLLFKNHVHLHVTKCAKTIKPESSAIFVGKSLGDGWRHLYCWWTDYSCSLPTFSWGCLPLYRTKCSQTGYRNVSLLNIARVFTS